MHFCALPLGLVLVLKVFSDGVDICKAATVHASQLAVLKACAHYAPDIVFPEQAWPCEELSFRSKVCFRDRAGDGLCGIEQRVMLVY